MDNKRLGRALEMAQLVRPNGIITGHNQCHPVTALHAAQSPYDEEIPAFFGPGRYVHALVKLQTRAEEIFGERNQKYVLIRTFQWSIDRVEMGR